MNWQVYQCTDPDCLFRFPAEVEQAGRRDCPRCGAEAQGRELFPQKLPEAKPAVIPPGGQPLILLLDNLRSTYNVGSLFRTAEGAGVAQIHLCGITPTPANPKVAKTALDAELRVEWRYHHNALQAVAELRASPVAVWALEVHPQARSLFALSQPQDRPLVLIAGNEVAGVDPGLLACSDHIVQLPMAGHKRSLNVASAVAIALYQLRFGAAGQGPTSSSEER